ncbi:MAG: hypothetical protein WAN41_08510, partial [Candidatus Sulfotelmatobacter sp.]
NFYHGGTEIRGRQGVWELRPEVPYVLDRGLAPMLTDQHNDAKSDDAGAHDSHQVIPHEVLPF